MLFKPELIEKIKAGEKTQTRRPVRGVNLLIDEHGTPAATDVPNFLDGLGNIDVVMTESGRALYQVGKTYAICPGRGKPQVARFKLLKIRYEDVRTISRHDAWEEGFGAGPEAFLKTWANFYDPMTLKESFLFEANWSTSLIKRPANLYMGWALTFELCR